LFQIRKSYVGKGVRYFLPNVQVYLKHRRNVISGGIYGFCFKHWA